MKRILGIVVLAFSLSACAQHQHHHNSHRHHGNYNWVVPAAIGGLVVYGITKQNEQYANPPVVVEQYQYRYPVYQNCTEWREFYRNGSRVLERTCFNR